MINMIKKVISHFLVICMLVTLVQIPYANNGYASANASDKASGGKILKADNKLKLLKEGNTSTGITLGVPLWNSNKSGYTFPDVKASFDSEKQKVFCISVENGGFFTAPIEKMDADNLDITAVESDGRYNANVNGDATYPLSSTRKLISLTVLGDMTESMIENYIKDMYFSRGSVEKNIKQQISLISTEFDAEKEGATAMISDGNLHFYKYIDWQFDTTISYKNGTTVTVPASSVKDDSSKFSWFKAYELAKKEKLNGLKGYLATITDISEQKYIYNKLGVPRMDVLVDGITEKWGGAWIGGARSFAAGEKDEAKNVIFDADIMDELYPADKDNNICVLWRWMCGPEAGEIFTTTKADGKNTDSSGVNGYSRWAGTEPNNYKSNSYKGFKQEYCLQYGYHTSNGEWNDWGPYHAPYGRRNSAITGSGEDINTTTYDMAPMGFIVEFSEYDINRDGETDDDEIMNTPIRKDVTEISALPMLESATLDKTYFSVGNKVSVSSVTGNYTVDSSGKGNDELLGTDIVLYQWEFSNDSGNTWSKIDGATDSSYTPTESLKGSKIRCHIYPKEDNEKQYTGDLYVGITSSDDSPDKINGDEIYEIEPVDLIFIKADPLDIKEPVQTDNTVNFVQINGNLLEKDKDYTLDYSSSDGELIISKDYLMNLDEDIYPAEITYNDGSTQPFKITVILKDEDDTTLIEAVDITFDKNSPEDKKEPVNKRKTVTGITIGTKELIADSDYSIDGGEVIIKKEALKELDNGEYDAVITYKNGSTQKFKVRVTGTDESNTGNNGDGSNAGDSNNTDLSVTPTDLIFEKSAPKNLVEKIEPGKTVSGFKIGDNELKNGEYSITGDSLIISSNYLNGLNNGEYNSVITYSDGTTQVFKITVLSYNQATVVKNPPLFKMYKDVILKKKFKIDLKGITKYAIVSYKSSKPKVASVNKNGIITGKRKGKAIVVCNIIQNGAYYSVRVTVRVRKKYKNVTTNYNLNKKALVKTEGNLPEYNVYKRVYKKKKTKIVFQKVASDAKVRFYVKNKKERKILTVGKAVHNKKNKTASCVIRGRKKGWAHLTAKIVQNGKTYYTRLLVRVDDGRWTKRQLRKYLR